MKLKKNKIIFTIGAGLFAIIVYSCSKQFLEKNPIGEISNSDLNNRAGVEGLLIGAYSLLDGSGLDNWMIESQRTSIWNAWAGSVASDDAHKGGLNGSQPERGHLQGKSYDANNSILIDRWKFNYAGVQRANDVIRQLAKLPEGEYTDAEKTQVIAEARFLRAIYHLELAKMWYNIPFIDETITAAANNFKVPNSKDFKNPTGWDKIEEDFKFAADNLTETKAQIGRANSWAAKAFLAKTYMQRAKLEEAKPLLDDIILNGVTASGLKYDLETDYSKLFRTGFKNGAESVFAVQMSVNDQGRNGNEGEPFNYPPWYPKAGGWGHMPSFNLVNAYKTQGGLPMLDNFNDVDVKNNFGQNVTLDTFDPETGPLDPRLDWTVGRFGLPYHDYGRMNQAYNTDNAVYYGKKWVVFASDATELVEGWKQMSAINYPMIRFADVLLWAAECEVEIGDINKALGYVNRVRTRAALPSGFLKTYVDNADPSKGFTNTPAANYVISTYPSFPDKAYARKAVRFERRLELATEGHRFFDLQRFDRIDEKYGNESGYMARVLNDYMEQEAQRWITYLGPNMPHGFLTGRNFVKGKHEVYCIPQEQIDLSKKGNELTLTQNPGFN